MPAGAAASRITAIIPYFGYGRADKRHGRREPITGRVVADMLQNVGVDHVVMVDPHTPQVEGFFYIPVESLTAVPALCNAIRERRPRDLVVVSADVGRVQMAAEYAECLSAPLVVLHKRRGSGVATEVTHVVGDVSNRACLIVDDMISTAGTVAESIKAFLALGARPEIIIAATHGLFAAGSFDKLNDPAVREVFVTDTVSLAGKDRQRLQVVSIAPLIARALERFLAEGSLGDVSNETRRTRRPLGKEIHDTAIFS